jgi:hypothetical protein
MERKITKYAIQGHESWEKKAHDIMQTWTRGRIEAHIYKNLKMWKDAPGVPCHMKVVLLQLKMSMRGFA